MHSHYILALLLALVFPIIATATVENVASSPVDAWKPIGFDLHVKYIAQFAVSEYNKAFQKNLIFNALIRAEYQIQSETVWRLLVVVKDESIAHQIAKYEAIVHEKPWTNFKKLVSFNPANVIDD